MPVPVILCVYVFRPGEGQLSPQTLAYKVSEEAIQSELPKPAPSMLVKGTDKSSDHRIWAFWCSWHPRRQEDEEQAFQSCTARGR